MQTVFLVGPTAVGKSAVAIAAAQQLTAEIVSADSMQIYRGMDIGTAKPSLAERKTISHHLIDVVDFCEPFDVAQYRRLALTAIADIHRRGKTALVVGGTGLYVRALTRGLDELPRADEELRTRLENQTLEKLVAQLRVRDPLASAKIDLKNKRRVVRALEVLELTGKSIVAQQGHWQSEGDASPQIIVGLARCREDLHRRIDERVDEMFARGLVDEVRGLMARGLEKNRTAMQAVGYKEVAAHLRGDLSLAECKQAVKIATRQLAKRQLTWFRRETSLHWIEAGQNETVEKTTKRFLELRAKLQEER